MRPMRNDLKLPLLLVSFISLCGILTFPIMPIDETRYVSAAWEMWIHHSFLVPLLNGAPYPHKPPLLFWLMHLSWAVFGVNEITPRLIPGIFSLLNLMLVYRISLRLWPQENRTAFFATLILASIAVWDIWSVAIMFDMVFTFWVLLGLLGILQAAEGDRRRHGLLLLAVGIAGGILTKGPAVLIYLLPLPFLRSLWSRRMDRPRRGKWYRSVSGALLLGAGIALLWVVPAILLGGASYRHEILWKQTADRITSSFAHRRPFWWYLPILPLLFFPWILFRPAFRRFRLKTADTGTRFCLLWMGIPLLIFSLISGKQVHYLLPFIPAGALLAGRNLCLSEFDGRKSSVKLFGLFYFAAGLVIACLPLIPLKTPAVVFAVVPTEIASAGLLSIGAFLYFFRFPSFSSAVKCLAVSTAVIAALTFFQIKNSLMESYDIKPVARAVQKNMENGRAVAHIGKYHGQYQFLGRLKQPLTVLDDNPDQISDFAKRWPGALFISYSRGKNTLPDDATVCYTHKYRGKTVVLWQMESAHGP